MVRNLSTHTHTHYSQLLLVPCIRRARQMEYTEDDSETQIKDEEGGDDEEDWMYTHSTRVTKTMDEIAQNIMTEEEEEAEIRKGLEKLNMEDIPDIDDIPDMDDQVEEENDPVSRTHCVS